MSYSHSLSYNKQGQFLRIIFENQLDRRGLLLLKNKQVPVYDTTIQNQHFTWSREREMRYLCVVFFIGIILVPGIADTAVSPWIFFHQNPIMNCPVVLVIWSDLVSQVIGY